MEPSDVMMAPKSLDRLTLSEVGSSESGTELFLYIACREDLAQRICVGGVIKAGFFGSSCQGWIPLAGSKQVAVEKAVHAQNDWYEAAENAQSWCFLRLRASAAKVLKAVTEEKLERVIVRGDACFRYFGDICIEDWEGEWTEAGVEALGVKRWADVVLPASFDRRSGGTCDKCHAESVPTWTEWTHQLASQRCAGCWFKEFSSRRGRKRKRV